MVNVGDNVRGVHFREGVYELLGFDESMEKYIGVVGEVSWIDEKGYCCVDFEEESYWYPRELLSKLD